MYALLKTTVEASTKSFPVDDDQNSQYVINPKLACDLKRKLLFRHIQSFDWEHGGLLSPVKFLDRDSIEYSLIQASCNDQTEARMARLTLSNSFALLDPAWGGVYQYSTRGDWEHPHFEKTMANQAGYLRIYILAYSLWKEQRFLLAANSIYDYMKRFLTSPDGAFYCGQSDKINDYDTYAYFSSDNQQRIEAGIPEINKNIYARENGWAIEALATLYEFTGDRSALHRAQRAANWIIKHRALSGGGYRHDENDEDGPYLGDSLAMGRAFLQLYRITGKQSWLMFACNTTDFISMQFRRRGSGYNRAIDLGEISRPAPQIDENISLTRFANLLFQYTGQSRFKEISKHGLRYLITPRIANARIEEAGILLADDELNKTPIRIVIIGEKNDPQTRLLHQSALRSFGWYKQIDCYRKISSLPEEMKHMNSRIGKSPAAFVINEYHCSRPAYDAATLNRLIKDM